MEDAVAEGDAAQDPESIAIVLEAAHRSSERMVEILLLLVDPYGRISEIAVKTRDFR
jgi:hypothetical protein